MCKFILALSLLFSLPFQASGKVLSGLIDQFGNPVHSADEFNITVQTAVNTVPQGFQYNYSLTNDPASKQAIWNFKIFLQDTYSFIPLTDLAPFAWGPAGVPFNGISPIAMSLRWSVVGHPITPELLQPNMMLTGFSFISPYPPSIVKAYAEGVTESPWYDSAPGGYDAFDTVTPYGPGKVFPVIGPVKPATPNTTDNYSVLGCAGGLCDMQLDITGPMDPYGTVYTYQWTGAFGSAVGAKPIVQLAAGNYNVSVAVSDPYATLVTATMPVTVVDPNPPVIVNPPATGAALTPAQVAALTPTALAALTPTQVSSIITLLSPAQIALLAPNQLVALSPAQVQSVSVLLSPAQLSAASSMTDDDSDDEHSDDNSDDDSSDSNSDDASDEDDKSN